MLILFTSLWKPVTFCIYRLYGFIIYGNLKDASRSTFGTIWNLTENSITSILSMTSRICCDIGYCNANCEQNWTGEPLSIRLSDSKDSLSFQNSEFFREKWKNKQIQERLKPLTFSGKSQKINKFTETDSSIVHWYIPACPLKRSVHSLDLPPVMTGMWGWREKSGLLSVPSRFKHQSVAILFQIPWAMIQISTLQTKFFEFVSGFRNQCFDFSSSVFLLACLVF